MGQSKHFDTTDEMLDYVVSKWNNLGFGELFQKEDLSISKKLNTNTKKDYRLICTKKMGDKLYEIPRYIAICSMD